MPRQEAVPEKLTNMNGPFVTPDWVGHTTIYEVNLRQYAKNSSFKSFDEERKANNTDLSNGTKYIQLDRMAYYVHKETYMNKVNDSIKELS